MTSQTTCSPRCSNYLFLFTFLWLTLGSWQVLLAADCAQPAARLVSAQGQVESATQGSTTWTPANLNDAFCPGDRLRVGADSRAGLVLHGDTLLRLDERTSVTLNAPTAEGNFWLDLLRGAAHFISRVKGTFKVETPYVNASIEGTEFVVMVKESAAEVVVFEGTVVASNPAGRVELTANQSARAEKDRAPVRTTLANPRDAVTWTLYYPPLPEQPDKAYDLALDAVTAIAQNRLDDAIDLATQAIAANNSSAAAYMAQSYVDQARFDIPAALIHSRRAAELAPDSALTQARLAEVRLMTGALRDARSAADKAVSLDPELSLAHTVQGFSSLRDVSLDAATSAFEKAIQLDSTAPLPRLGLGLTLVRQGDLTQGRRELETAVLLDPNSALLRSYLGKAYYEEKRSGVAADQFAMAKELDPNDPTAWFYDSILLQSENRPVEALQAQQQAIALNDNRGVYRSRQLLDQDEAARNVASARIYTDLGFERLSLKESWKSLATDPANSSAHRLLSDSYVGLPRHENARVSELLQTQMLAPEIVAPVSPSASETNLLAFQGSGPTQTGFNEYNPLFNRQRLSLLASGVTGGSNTRGNEIAVGGFTNRGMLSAGYFKESSDGYRENNDSEQTIKNVFGQFRISSSLSIQGEFKRKESEHGDLFQRFDPNVFSTVLRRNTDSDSSRIGINYSPNANNTFLYSGTHQKLTDSDDQVTTAIDLRSDNTQHEFQYLHTGEILDLLAGLGKVTEDDEYDTKVTVTIFPGFPPQTIYNSFSEKYDQKSAYAYAHLSWSNMMGIVGIDYFALEQDTTIDKKEFNPKLGFLWDVSSDSKFRFAAFKTYRGIVVNNQTLAPTQVAGFNQLLDDALGAQTWHYGAAIDSKLGNNLYGGIELTRNAATTFVTSGSSTIEQDQQELNHEAYLSWLFSNSFSLSGRYIYQDFEREYEDGKVNVDKPAGLHTQTLALQLSYHHSSGIFSEFETDFVSQEIANILRTGGTQDEDDSFAISNLSVGMRLPQRRGTVEIKAYNLFDNDIEYQSIHPGTGTPLTSKHYPERYVSAQVKLNF